MDVTAPVRAAEIASRVEVEGATIRLALGQPTADGRVDGVIALDLEPGWKTYWIDPGPVGLAPMFDFSGSTGLGDPRIAYPPPVRFREGEQRSVGYDAPVLVPFSLARTGDDAPRADLRLQIGLCRDLCVPVAEQLSALPSASLSTRAEILAARRALAVDADAGDVSAAFDGTTLKVRLPARDGDAVPDLFPHASAGWRIDQPTMPPTLGTREWTFLFRARLANDEKGAILPPVDLVLTQAGHADSFHDVPVRRTPPSAVPPPAEGPP